MACMVSALHLEEIQPDASLCNSHNKVDSQIKEMTICMSENPKVLHILHPFYLVGKVKKSNNIYL